MCVKEISGQRGARIEKWGAWEGDASACRMQQRFCTHGNWLVTVEGHPYCSMAITRLLSDIKHLIIT